MNETSFTSDIIEKSQFEDSFNSQNLLSETCSNSERAENSEYQDSIIGCNTSERSQVEDLEYHNSFNSQNDSVSSDSIFEKSVEEPSVLEEINLPSPILKNSKRSPHIDIYEFVDEEPPPPIRAPEICDDDLFEKSSFAEDSDVLSIVSSALQTSGSSTESLPFGHLEFELPNIKTSTPMKTQFKGWTGNNISLLSKKTSAVAIKRAQKDCGCMKSCTSNLSRKEIKQSRLTYWNMTSDKRSKWIFEKCNDFQSSPSRNEQLSFRLKGQSVCKIAWLQAYGISKSSFYRCKTKWLNNSLYGKSSSNNQSLKEQKQTAIHWLGEYVAKRGERPPHQQEVWLPFGLRKNEIFNAYKNEQIMECRQFISSTAFYKIWKDFYGHVKIRSTNLFTKCTVCVKLDRALQFQLVPAKRQNIFREKQEHLHRIMMEKLAYYRRRTISRRRPDRYISLIIDGMDQAKTNLPHYKDRKGKDFASTVPLKTHVSAVISHGTNEKFVYTDLHQYPHDSNLTINILMKTLKNISQGKPLSPVLYLQADNCFRENKNKFVLSFLELLVQKRIFYEIQLSFLHVGHTHEDIDQMFSVFADKLRHTDAPTLPILRSLMAESKELGGCFDVSSWLEPYLAKVKYHTRSSIFRYRLDEAKDKVMVYYRKNSCQTWKVLRHGFFKVDNNEKPVYPSSTPSILVMSFDKILLNDLNRSFEVWKSYMRNDEQDWWKKFIAFVSKMQSSQIALQQRSRNGAVWCLNTFRLFNRRALQDASDNTDPIPTDLRQQLQNEQGNPEGINLSGGQKQRVNLARAVYSNSDIYLFDDPLSAVDSHVGKDIFKKVIGPDGMLRKKTRILVTHGVHWLPKVDEIIVFDHGGISEQGKFKHLIQHNGPFSQFLQTYLLQESDEEDENDPEIYNIKNEIRDQIERLTSDGLTSDDGLLIKDGISSKVRKVSQKESINTHRQRSGTIMADKTRDLRISLRRSSRKYSESIESNIKPRLMAHGRLIQEEMSQEGSVNLSVFTKFTKAMGVPMVILAIICLFAQQGLQIACNLWITFWTEDTYLKNASLIHTQKYTETKYYYLGMYGLLVILQAVTLFLYAIITFTSFVRATGTIHNKGLDCVIRSPMSFFDTTPVGRIMNRFSSDIDVMDDKYPRSFRTMSLYAMILLGTVIIITFTTPVAAIAFVPILLLYIGVVKWYLPCARQLKRIESVTRSPLYNHFSESISGASVIRAYRSVDRFINELYRRLDINSGFYYAANTGMGWVSNIIQTLATLMLLAVSLFGVLSSNINGADLGLAITYSFQLVLAMASLIRATTDMQMNVISLERIEEYMFLSPEADWVQRHRPAIGWPHRGTIGFNDYKTRYRPGLELVLKGVTFFVSSGEKVGIVGRTGAGKSSLTQALFRLIEPAEGNIEIDDIYTSNIGLHDLRRKITILPQDPALFSDTFRLNLDPLVKFSDKEIWKALECVHLKQFVINLPGQLMSEIGEGGNNLSVGQRQLVCLARTLLHKTNILILDEATAAVDMETDDLIQETIREQFSDCTILCIAHRLSTVLDYDRIMVMDNGTIVEFDTPDNLLKNKDGVFYSMAKDAGICLS